MNAQESLASEYIDHNRLEGQRMLAIRLGDIDSACRIWAAMVASERRQEELKREIPIKAMSAPA